MEELKEIIFRVLSNEGNHADIDTLSKILDEDIKPIKRALEDLIKDGLVVDKSNRYELTNRLKVTLKKDNGKYYIIDNEGNTIVINKPNLNGAKVGDTIVVELLNKKEAKVKKVLETRLNNVGTIVIIDDKAYIKDNGTNTLIPVEETELPIVEGHCVVYKKYTLVKGICGTVTKIFGHQEDPDIKTKNVAAVYNFFTDFNNDVTNETKEISTEVNETDIIGRRDLRKKTFVTVDPEGAKDFDDAICIEILPNGNYMLYVSIADVGHYVKEGSEIDKEAYKRGTSVYLANKVIPMLPHKISNGICSLNEGVDRLTLTASFEIDKKGNIKSSDVFEAVINSKKQMTYGEVLDVLENKSTDECYTPFKDDLKSMFELSKILGKKRISNGAIELDIPESKIIVDESGKVIDVIKKKSNDATRIVEEFMLLTNESIAKYVFDLDIPVNFRVHGSPELSKLEQFVYFINSTLNKSIKCPKNGHSKEIQKIVDSLSESDNFEIYCMMLLRCMKKAVYSVDNIGHNGLAINEYAHFTSPIRRYPDLILHRIVKKIKSGKFKYNVESINELYNYLQITCEYLSKQEQRAKECEREVNNRKFADYMRKHIGEIFTGKITFIDENGFYVDFYNGIQGFVSITSLNRAKYNKDNYLISDRDNNQYTIGYDVSVVVTSITGTSKINLSLLSNENIKIKKKRLVI